MTSGPGTHTVELDWGEDRTGVNFGNREYNAPPTLDALSAMALPPQSPEQTVALTGITAGPGESQLLQVTASSDNTAFIPDPTVSYLSPNESGSLSFTPVAGQAGTATITVLVTDAGLDNDFATTEDNESFSRSFTVTVAEPTIIDNTDSEFSASNEWYTDGPTGYGENSSHWTYSQVLDNNRAEAVWQTNVQGTFEVFATWVGGAEYAEDASYEIWDGDELLGSVMVDQSQDPAADYESDGANFQALGESWTITEGPIRVVLSNVISVYGKRIMADAVRIAPENNNGAPSFDDQAFTLAENSSEGTAVGTLAATDPEGHALSYSIPVNIDPDGDGTAAFRIEGDRLLVNDSGDLDYETGPQLVITAEASDGSLSDSAQVTVNLTDVNDAPVVTHPGNQSAAEGDAVSLQLLGSDPDGDALLWTATGLPTGLSLDVASGLVSGTLSYDDAGSYSVQISASDGSLSGSTSFAWTVTNTNRAPDLASPGNQNHAEGDAISLQLTGSDPDGDSLTWTAWGLPTGLSLDATSGLIFGTLGFDAAGYYNVQISATDGSLSGSTTFAWAVTNTNRAPVMTDPGNQTHSEGDAVSLQLVGSDPDGDSLTWNASGLPTGLSLDAASGLITGTLGFDAAGSHAATVSVSDGSLSASTSFTWTITNTNRAPVVSSPGNQSDAEGDTVSLQVVGSDPDGDALTWNGSGLPTGLSLDTASGLISGTLGFDAAGSHTATVSVSDGSLSGTTSFAWTVTNTNRAPAITSSATATVAENTTSVLTLAATDPDTEDSLTFAITGGADAARFAIETELVALRFISPPDFETPDSAAGTNLYELEVTVSDEGGLTDLQNITVTVTNVDEIPLITLLGDAVVNLEVDPGGTYSDAGTTAWDPEDGDLSQAVEVGGQIVDLSLPGTYRITYDCEDLTGNAAVQVTRTVNVVAANAAPSLPTRRSRSPRTAVMAPSLARLWRPMPMARAPPKHPWFSGWIQGAFIVPIVTAQISHRFTMRRMVISPGLKRIPLLSIFT